MTRHASQNRRRRIRVAIFASLALVVVGTGVVSLWPPAERGVRPTSKEAFAELTAGCRPITRSVA